VPRDAFEPEGLELLTPLIVLRAFASGSVGLTGSEAIANGVPNFKPPESRNAVVTLVWMGAIFGTLFVGITYLATRIGIVPDQSELETVNSMLTRSLVGDGTPFYFVVQISTAIILLQAALISSLVIQSQRRRLAEARLQARSAEMAQVARMSMVGALTASVLFGFLYQRFGAPVAFGTGAALAAIASVLLGLIQAPTGDDDAHPIGARPREAA